MLFFCRRTFTGLNTRDWDYAFLAGIAFTVTYTIWLVIILLVICRPVQANWELSTHPGEYADACLPPQNGIAIFWVFAVCTSLSDLYMVVIPCLATRKFLLRKRQRLGLSIMFSLGLLVLVASLIRNYYMIKWSYNAAETRSWATFDINVWWQLEIQLGIICACAPALKSSFVIFSTPVGSTNFDSTRRGFSIEVKDEVRITSEGRSHAPRDPYDLGFLDNDESYTVEIRASRGHLRTQDGETCDEGRHTRDGDEAHA